MCIRFEWDGRKAKKNEKKHGVSFEEASSSFGDIKSITISDPDHSDEEERLILIGTSVKNRQIVVVHTEKDDVVRIISARKATRKEKKQYEEPKKQG